LVDKSFVLLGLENIRISPLYLTLKDKTSTQ